MSKFIGVSMIEANLMPAHVAVEFGYNIGNHDLNEMGYEVIYSDGYKSWHPADEFEKAYFELSVEDKITPTDIDNFIAFDDHITAGSKNTVSVLTCLTGFEAIGTAACVKPENYNINIGKTYSTEKAKDQIWTGLGFVLQWAINGIKFVKPNKE